MRRDKAWWARLTPEERKELAHIERAPGRFQGARYAYGGYAICCACGTAIRGWGLCQTCSDRAMALRAKAAGAA
jgi:hypothetical protein